MRQELSFTRIFRELASLLSAAWREAALFTAVIGSVGAAGFLAGIVDPSADALDFSFKFDTSEDPLGSLFDLGLGIVTLVATYLLLSRYLSAHGRSRVVENRFWPYFGMALLSGVGIVFGAILLIVPGLILIVRWCAASGYLIGAGQGVTESLGSSWDATSGHGWPIFFAIVVLYVGIIVISGVIGGVVGVASLDAVNVIIPFLEAATSALFSAFGIAIFCLVADDSEELAKTFA
jgi:hypothetical protein